MEQREAGFKQQHPMNDERRIQIDHNSLPATLERYSIPSYTTYERTHFTNFETGF